MVIAKRQEFLELSTEILGKGNNLRFRALGGSMHPFIKNGEVVEVKPVKSLGIKVGEVVFYRSSRGGMVAHRVIRKKAEKGKVILETKGDAVPNSDWWVYPEQILGKVVAIERNGGTLELNKGLNRITSLIWAKASPFSRWIYPIYRGTKRGAAFLLRSLVEILQNLLEILKGR